jgi:hypothetical protein
MWQQVFVSKAWADHRAHPPRLQKPSGLKDETWPEAKTTHEKLYGPVEELKRTTTFITRAALQV